MTDTILSEFWAYPLQWGDTLSNHDWYEMHSHRLLSSRFVTLALANDRRQDIATALVLWSESFRQDPAGTLPSDDLELCALARFRRLEEWREAKPFALYGWRPTHVDGEETRAQDRLGHPFLTQVVERMFRRKTGRDQGRAAARLAVMRSRVKKRLLGLGRKSLAANGQIIGQVADWLDQNSLYVNDDNVLAALEMLGAPAVVRPMRGVDGAS